MQIYENKFNKNNKLHKMKNNNKILLYIHKILLKKRNSGQFLLKRQFLLKHISQDFYLFDFGKQKNYCIFSEYSKIIKNFYNKFTKNNIIN